MKKIIKNILAFSTCAILLSGCSDFFEKIPGTQLDMDDTFSNRQKTLYFLNNVYTYLPDDATGERWYGKDGGTTNQGTADRYGGIWSGASLESNWSWAWHNTHKWNLGSTSASSMYVTFWWKHYYEGINKASIFLENIDSNPEVNETDKKHWKAEARALRAMYYFYVFRQYGPCVLLGDESVALDTPVGDLLKPRSTVDEVVDYIVSELDAAADDLTQYPVYRGVNLGKFDRGQCKAYKAKVLLYAASPLFNGNTMFESVKNTDGTHLFPQTADKSKWERAKLAYEEFLNEFVPTYYELYVHYTNNVKDPYESYRRITQSASTYHELKENISLKLVDHSDLNYAITPYHNGYRNGAGIDGGLGLAVSQQFVDLFFTDKGVPIELDPDYQAKDYGIGVVPSAQYYGSDTDYNDPKVPSRNYFKANTNLTLKQWENREPRFYVCVTYNGSTWLNTETSNGAVTTTLHLNGNSGQGVAGHDAPYTGYGFRKTARSSNEAGVSKHHSINLRLADMYLGYAECCSATGDYAKAIEYINYIRNRAGVPEYGPATEKDDNGFDKIPYTADRDYVDKLVHRERLIELALEANRFFDVRRWMVADMAKGDIWHYPEYNEDGEGGAFIGLNYRYDPPEFFRKVTLQERVFEKRHYLMPIPDNEVRRNPLMVQNYDWKAAEAGVVE